jgi:hypothetical protein
LSYQHSESFASLKSIKEGIESSLTSYQWLATLDYFIEAAIDPMVTALPLMVNNYYAKVVAWQAHKPSIKFSRINKHDLPVLLFNSITTEGKTSRAFQKEMLLNRGLLFGLINLFQHTVNGYMQVHNPATRITDKDRLLKLAIAAENFDTTYLYAAARESQYWADKAYEFKKLIVQKYTRLALMNAKSVYQLVHTYLKLDDIVQTYLVFLSKAIDRCDSRQGVLTTFIQTWFHSAKALTMKEAQERHQQSSFDEQHETTDMSVAPDSSYEEVQHIACTAKRIDALGILRVSLGIPEFLNQRQLATLTNHVKQG